MLAVDGKVVVGFVERLSVFGKIQDIYGYKLFSFAAPTSAARSAKFSWVDSIIRAQVSAL
jgi:hypothetical protein